MIDLRLSQTFANKFDSSLFVHILALANMEFGYANSTLRDYNEFTPTSLFHIFSLFLLLIVMKKTKAKEN